MQDARKQGQDGPLVSITSVTLYSVILMYDQNQNKSALSLVFISEIDGKYISDNCTL